MLLWPAFQCLKAMCAHIAAPMKSACNVTCAKPIQIAYVKSAAAVFSVNWDRKLKPRDVNAIASYLKINFLFCFAAVYAAITPAEVPP